MKSEIRIQDEIRLALSEYGPVFRMNTGVFKTADGRTIKCGVKGMSDLLFVGQGFIAWIEVKNEVGRPTKEQTAFIKRMRALGHRAGIARSVEEAREIIKAV